MNCSVAYFGGPREPPPFDFFFIYVKIMFYEIFKKKVEKSLKSPLSKFSGYAPQWFRMLKNRTKREKMKRLTSITKIFNLRTSGFRYLSLNLFEPLDVFFEVINWL